MNTSASRLVWVVTVVLAGLGLAVASPAWGQGVDLANRPIAEVRLDGLKTVNRQLVLNQIRSLKGDAYNPQTVSEDIGRLTHLGRFSSVQARVAALSDGTVVLTFDLVEQPLLSDVQVVGNKELSDQELLELVMLRSGDPADPFLIEQARTRIKQAYEKKGRYQTDVVIEDTELLREAGVLILRVREGPMIRIRKIRFEGNTVFSADELDSKIKSGTYMWILEKGELNRDKLEADAARVRQHYQDNGYLEAQVSRRIDPSPDQRDAVVTFLVSEGRQFVVSTIRFEGNVLFSDAQLLAAMPMKIGDVYSAERFKKSQEGLVDFYGKLGFMDAKITVDRLYHPDEPKVDLLVKITEGHEAIVGRITVAGNQTTQDKVAYRAVRGLEPGRRFDRAGIAETEKRLREGVAFGEANVTVLGEPGDEVRDVLLEVKEKNSGSISFGAGISSDSGVIGSIELIQRNFDISDGPESAGDFFSGRAFRGAGQYFALRLQPGNESSNYSISWADPYFLESDFSINNNLFLYSRDRDMYNEDRMGGNVAFGHRFGDTWYASTRLRGEQVSIDSIDTTAPRDVWQVQGDSLITAVGFSIRRSSTDSSIFPTTGSSTELGVNRAGMLGGDYEFTTLTSEFRRYWTINEDFNGNKSVLIFRNDISYILEDDEAPVFERLYAGGHRSFRGFSYRGVGPRGIRNDNGLLGSDPVGGDFMFLLGLEYNFPIYQDIFRMVVFLDTGTVQKDLGLDEYRASIGAGFRIKIPFLGQAPFALDFAIPLMKQEGDETQFVSFDLGLPF